MKIAIVSHFPINTDNINGGVEAVTANLVEGLTDFHDLEIHVVTINKEINQDITISKKNYTLYILHSPPFPVLLNTLTFDRKKIRATLREINPHIIHSHDIYAYMTLDIGIPTLVSLHGIIHEDTKFYYGLKGEMRSLIWNYIEKSFLNNSKYLIAQNNYVKEAIKNYFHGTVYVVDNPVSSKFFEIKKPNNGTEEIILFVGKIHPIKGIDKLLKAIEIVRLYRPKVKLHLAGTIANLDYFHSLTAFIKKQNLEENIVFKGNLRESDLLEEYSNSKILLLPSNQEAAPMVVEQAMAAGKPVVASNVGGIPFLVKNNETGFLIEKNDIKEMALKISILLKNKDLRIKMGQNARREALEKFHPKIVAQRTREIYREIISRNKR
ncbi:MAG: hypothetical protein AMJ45_00350 [Syntrophobacter sp. DG_60]|nr:MAG: hypothetical protein AMJ45_00350 [Syntrophobacter sp. DG_60]